MIALYLHNFFSRYSKIQHELILYSRHCIALQVDTVTLRSQDGLISPLNNLSSADC